MGMQDLLYGAGSPGAATGLLLSLLSGHSSRPRAPLPALPTQGQPSPAERWLHLPVLMGQAAALPHPRLLLA